MSACWPNANAIARAQSLPADTPACEAELRSQVRSQAGAWERVEQADWFDQRAACAKPVEISLEDGYTLLFDPG